MRETICRGDIVELKFDDSQGRGVVEDISNGYAKVVGEKINCRTPVYNLRLIDPIKYKGQRELEEFANAAHRLADLFSDREDIKQAILEYSRLIPYLIREFR